MVLFAFICNFVLLGTLYKNYIKHNILLIWVLFALLILFSNIYNFNNNLNFHSKLMKEIAKNENYYNFVFNTVEKNKKIK